MRGAALWKLSVRTTPTAEDDIRNFLADTFGESPVSYTDFETSETIVSVYLEYKPDRGLVRQAKLAAPAGIALEKVRWQDWAESWKRHFRPIEIGSSLLIRPSWSRRRARKGQATVVLDPGLSFGTGQHPTTAFCLEQLVTRRVRGQSQSLLDLGSGSGILAIAGAKLGYAPITAMDFDASAVRIARANAKSNRVARRIRFLQQDVAKLPRKPLKKYSVVCANLVASLLLTEPRRILAQLERTGILIVAGILKTEFHQIRKAYLAEGLRLVTSRIGNEWRSAAFARKRYT